MSDEPQEATNKATAAKYEKDFNNFVSQGTKAVEQAIANSTVEAKKVQNLGLQDKIDFTSTFQILAQSGIPVIESLAFIENDAAKLKLRILAKELRRQIMAGSTFADTIAKYPKIFGQIYIGLSK